MDGFAPAGQLSYEDCVSSDEATSQPSAGWLDHAPVTSALIALDVAIFVVQLVLTWGRSLLALPVGEKLAFGASYSLAVVGEYRWETLVTACFLHDGVLHLGLNTLLLWLAGPVVERGVGSARMAPLYLASGVVGNLASVWLTWLHRDAVVTVGASGAISGVFTAALVLGWRLQGWRGPLTQAMLRWLGLLVAIAVLSRRLGGADDNAAHLGGALTGVVIALLWRRDRRYPARASRIVLGACAALVVACVGVVGWHDRTDPFATMLLPQRFDFTSEALADGRCRDAYDGLLAVERLRAKMAPVTSLRYQVEVTCGHLAGSR
jgi:membrane associated rhomboid family serine protease